MDEKTSEEAPKEETKEETKESGNGNVEHVERPETHDQTKAAIPPPAAPKEETK